MTEYTLSEIEAMPTLEQAHFDTLKIDGAVARVWISRMTVEDGAPYNNQVTVEILTGDGNWKTVAQYEAK